VEFYLKLTLTFVNINYLTFMPRKFEYTEQQMINYVFLLHFRYGGEIVPLYKDMGVPCKRLAKMQTQYLDQVKKLLKEDKCAEVFNQSEIPSLNDLYDKAMRRLEIIIEKATDAPPLINALYKLHDLKKRDQEASPVKSFYEDLNEKLSGK